MPRDIESDPDDNAPSGSTIVPAQRRSRVAVTRGVQITDLSDPECWATQEEEAPEVVHEDALEDAADRAEVLQERGSPLDADLQASVSELLRSLPPLPTNLDDIDIDEPRPSEVETVQPVSLAGLPATRLMIELVLVVSAGVLVTGLCSAWVISRFL